MSFIDRFPSDATAGTADAKMTDDRFNSKAGFTPLLSPLLTLLFIILAVGHASNAVMSSVIFFGGVARNQNTGSVFAPQ